MLFLQQRLLTLPGYIIHDIEELKNSDAKHARSNQYRKAQKVNGAIFSSSDAATLKKMYRATHGFLSIPRNNTAFTLTAMFKLISSAIFQISLFTLLLFPWVYLINSDVCLFVSRRLINNHHDGY